MKVITAGKKPLEWESELLRKCGSLSQGCFHIWNKTRSFQKLKERSTPNPQAALALRLPGHPSDGEQVVGLLS